MINFDFTVFMVFPYCYFASSLYYSIKTFEKCFICDILYWKYYLLHFKYSFQHETIDRTDNF